MRDLTVDFYPVDRINRDHDSKQKETQNCCCGKCHSGNQVPELDLPRYPHTTNKARKQSYQGQTQQKQQLPSLPRYPKPQPQPENQNQSRLRQRRAHKQGQYWTTQQQTQRVHLVHESQAQWEDEQQQLSQYRIGRFMSDDLPQTRVQEQFPVLRQHSHAIHQVAQHQPQSKTRVEQSQSIPSQKEPVNLPQYPVALSVLF